MVIAVARNADPQRPVNPAAVETIGFALAAWMTGVVIVCLFASLLGAPARAAALAVVLALAPALVTLLLAPRSGENGAASILIGSWIAAASSAVALTGGALSPLAVLFALPTAFAFRLFSRARAMETLALSITGYAVSAVSANAVPMLFAPVAPGSFAVLSLTLAGWLVATTPARAAPVASADVRRIGEVAHELRTPINHILGFAQVMQQQLFGPLDGKYAEYAGHIVDAGRRMNALATDWLDMARLDAGRYAITRERFDLAMLVRDAVDAASVAGWTGEIAHEGADGEIGIEADARAVRQIVDNLVTNATKFTPAGGRIVVRLTTGPRAVAIEVIDNGPGLSAADKRRLARPFERGAGVGAIEGAGLGLTLVKALAQAHGGRFEILDADGGGARMRVLLPF